MSFNDAGNASAGRRKPLLDKRDISDTQRVQEAVRRMRTAAADMQKEARVIGAPGRSARGARRTPEERQRDEASRQKVDQAFRMAQGAGEEASSLLKELAASGEAAKGQKGRLVHQKLSEELKSATDAVALAFEVYDTLAREMRGTGGEGAELTDISPEAPSMQSPAAASAATAAAPSQASAPARGGGSWNPFSRKGPSPEEVQKQIQEQVTDAEVATHVAIVDEYVEEITNVNKEVRILQGAMQDLAAHTVAQGQVLDTIDGNVAESAAATTDANEELVSATQRQQWGNKCLIGLLCGIVTLSIVVIIVVAIRS